MSRARNALKLAIGRVAELALPALGREIDEDRNPARAPALKRAILYARLRRAQAAGDASAIEGALAAFWTGQAGDRFHDRFADERFGLFREHHAVTVEVLAGLVEDGLEISRLVEIGCGDGAVAAYCAERLTAIPQVVGLDINAAVIARNCGRQPAGSRLSFVRGEARDWLTANPQPGTAVLTNAGVLEYLSQENLDRLLQALAPAPPAAVALIEPVAPEHDLDRQDASFVFGREKSFSHNHRRRLENAGFEIVWAQETRAWDTRWMMMVGVRR